MFLPCSRHEKSSDLILFRPHDKASLTGGTRSELLASRDSNFGKISYSLDSVKTKEDKMINSCQKGKRGDRAARDYLMSLGYTDCHRTQQHNGIGLSDISCPDSLPALHLEVKYGYSRSDFSVGSVLWQNAIDQAHEDSSLPSWAMLWREKGCVIWKMTFLTEWGLVTVAGDVAIRSCLDTLQTQSSVAIRLR